MDTVTGVRVAVATARGGRTRNEDAVGVNGWIVTGEADEPLRLVLPVAAGRPALVAVTDGMGGAPAGDRAARIAAGRVTTALNTHNALPLVGTPLAQLVPDAFAAAHAAVRAAGQGPDQGMGCTAGLLVVCADGSVLAAHVGDVRAYRIVDAYAGQLTEDHRSDPRSPVVSRCLGGMIDAPPIPDIYRVSVRAGDRLVLCSDGIHDAVGAATIEQAAHHRTGAGMAAELVAAAVATTHGDNATVAVLDIAGAPLPPPAPDPPSAVETQPVPPHPPVPAVDPSELPPPLEGPSPDRRPGLLHWFRSNRSRR